jgi:hypothetical protein
MPGPSESTVVTVATNHYMSFNNTSPHADGLVFPTLGKIYDMVNDGYPVALFGSYKTSPIEGDNNLSLGIGQSSFSHAVTVHKVERDQYNHWFGINTYGAYKMYAHFGWGTTYNNVCIWEGHVTRGGMMWLGR